MTDTAHRAAAETLVRTGEAVDLGVVKLERPLAAHGKIICVGLNYADHASEASMKAPDYPTLFARFPSSLIAHDEPIVRPRVSDKLDYEGELVAVIGKGGRYIPRAAGLSHVCGYSIFNDGSIRDFQLRTPRLDPRLSPPNGRSARITTIPGRSARFLSAPTNCRPARMA